MSGTAITISSCIIAALGMLANIGRSRLLSSPEAGSIPMVSRLYRISRSPARKTVRGRDSLDSSSWWKAVFRSSLVKVDCTLNIGIMSSTRGIRR